MYSLNGYVLITYNYLTCCCFVWQIKATKETSFFLYKQIKIWYAFVQLDQGGEMDGAG